MNISNWLSAALLNATLRNTAFSSPATVYLALYTSDPTPADTGTEVTGGGYKRMPITFAAPFIEQVRFDKNGQTVTVPMQTVKNAADVEFPIATADWGLVSHIGLRTAATGGNLLFSSAIKDANGNPNPRTIQKGDNPKFLKDGTLVRFTN